MKKKSFFRKFKKKDLKIFKSNCVLNDEFIDALCRNISYSIVVGKKIICIFNIRIYKTTKIIEISLACSNDIEKYTLSLVKNIKKIIQKHKKLEEKFKIVAVVQKDLNINSRFVEFFGFLQVELINNMKIFLRS